MFSNIPFWWRSFSMEQVHVCLMCGVLEGWLSDEEWAVLP
jgi:hypothetical protein